MTHMVMVLCQKNVRNPNHHYFSNKYRNTPPICIAIRLQFVLQCFWCPYALRKGKYCQYSSHLYRSTPPICVAIRLPFVSQYFWENLGGCGHRNVPHSDYSSSSLSDLESRSTYDSGPAWCQPWRAMPSTKPSRGKPALLERASSDHVLHPPFPPGTFLPQTPLFLGPLCWADEVQTLGVWVWGEVWSGGGGGVATGKVPKLISVICKRGMPNLRKSP